MPACYQKPGIHDASTPSTGVRVSSLGSLPAPSSRVCHWDYTSRDPGSVSTMLHQLGREQHEHRRVRNRVIMFYKIYHHIVEVPVHHLLQVTNSRTRGSMANTICQISTRGDVYKNSFIPATIIAWNNITER